MNTQINYVIYAFILRKLYCLVVMGNREQSKNVFELVGIAMLNDL